MDGRPGRWEFDDAVGPFLTVDGVRKRLGGSRRRVDALADENGLLRVVTSDGVTLFPALQFDGGRLVAGLRHVLEAFGAADPWMVTTWLATPAPDLADRIPIELVR